MQIHNAAVTGSFTYNGIDISDITGSEQSVVSLNEFSASILNYTSSNNQSVATLQGATASLQGATSSLFAYTASNSANVANLFATSASLNAAVTQIYNATASLYAATASIYGATSSLFNYSASSNLRIGSLEQYTASLNTRSASFACVDATNTFACAQYFSNTSNAISFSSTGSLYSDGGMRLTKDLYVSGTSYFNNVTVFGTQSINYITSSQLNIASNLITVNTSTPAVRFGGLAVYDSGSLGTGLTGSILWDSEANHWVYSNPSGSTYSGGMFISGPRSAALGSEQGTTACALMIGQGGDHITSSGIFHYGNATCFYGNATIQSTGAACFASNVCINDKVVILDPTDGSATALFIGTKDGAMTVGQQVRLDFSQITTPLARIAGEYTGGTFSSALAFSTNATCTETLTEQLRIDCNGIACFRNTVCSPAFVGGTVSGTTGTFSGKICANTAGTVTSGFADGLNLGSWDAVGYTSTGTDLVLGGYRASQWSGVQIHTSGASRLAVSSTGIACFACQVCSGVGFYASSLQSGITIDSTTNGDTIIASRGLSSALHGIVRTVGQNGVTCAMLISTRDSVDGNLPASVNALWGLTNNAMVIATNNVERMRVANTGIACFACQVCAPTFLGSTATLSTAGTACTVSGVLTLASLQTGGASVCAGAAIVFEGNAGATVARIYSRGNMNFNNGSDLVFQTQVSAGGTPQCTMVINGASQSVGIGTFSPSAQLHIVAPYVQNTSAISAMWSGVGGFTATLTCASGVQPYATYTFGNGNIVVSTNNPTIRFQTITTTTADMLQIIGASFNANAPYNCNKIAALNSSHLSFETAGSSRMVIDNAGNIGLNCTTPGVTLDVGGFIRTNTGVTITKSIIAGEATPLHLTYACSDGSGPAVRFGSGANGFWDIQPSNNNQRLFFEWSDSTNLLTFKCNGYVGVNCIDPAYSLHVNGQIYSSNTVSAANSRILNLQSSNTYANNSANTVTGAISEVSGIIRIINNLDGTNTDIPFYASGGSGVAYQWTVLDPDSGWLINQSGWNFNFTTNGSQSRTFNLQASNGSGNVTIQQASGTANYTMKIFIYSQA